MAITFRSARVWVPGVVSCLVLLGQATGALANEASAASRTASDAAPAGRPFIPAPGQLSVLQGVSCPSVTSCWAVSPPDEDEVTTWRSLRDRYGQLRHLAW
jgi:hypothetical protein